MICDVIRYGFDPRFSRTGRRAEVFRVLYVVSCLLYLVFCVFVIINHEEANLYRFSSAWVCVLACWSLRVAPSYTYVPGTRVSCVVVLTLTHRYNAVRGHRTGSNNSGAQDYPRSKTSKKQKIIHAITETIRKPQTKIKR